MEKDIPFLKRSIGVLLHPTALPTSSYCGTFGAPARKWLNLLSKNGIGVWQFLPLAPPDSTGSPYSSPSGFSFNPCFLDLDDLIEDGYLSTSTLNDLSIDNNEKVDFLDFELADRRTQLIGKALRIDWLKQNPYKHSAFKSWCRKESFWIEDHVTFMALRKEYLGLPWWEWPTENSSYNLRAIWQWRLNHKSELLENRLIQWHLDRQWQDIRRLAKNLGILLFGDLPFYVSRDSVDVWRKRVLFSISPKGEMDIQSGVPPDYFSSTGQLWGTPVYFWPFHQITRFRWWRKRLRRNWAQFDLLRLDHFRALDSYWAVSGDQKTAENGSWQKSPGESLLKVLSKDCNGQLPLIAEDLGIITNEVKSLREKFLLPGMKILQFGFDGDTQNPYLPENIHGENWIVYSGTHDNPTTQGWWDRLDSSEKERILIRADSKIDSPVWKIIDLGLSTEAALVIIPLQDLLGLDDSARFNTPGTVNNNWKWRLNSFDDKLENALDYYAERGQAWGRGDKK